MLIEFRVENYRSIRDEQAFSFESSRVGDADDMRPRKVTGIKEKLLPAAAIYGANASGKSNLLSALAFMWEAVLYSHRAWEPEGGVPRTPFAWGDKKNESSMFEVTILISGVKYLYGFVVSDEKVEEEWLFAWPNNHKQKWFEREGDQFKFGEYLKGQNEIIEELTRPNSLFLSAAVQNKHEQLSLIYNWFRNIKLENFPRRPSSPFLALRLAERLFSSEDIQLKSIQKLIQKADIGITDIKTIEIVLPFSKYISPEKKIKLQHVANDEDSWLDLSEESQGTKTLIRMAPAIFNVLERGGLLLVDELESSLHPHLGQAIVRLFNSPETNPNNAQILFTTHDTNLLGTTLGEPVLRRDQIWFVEKDQDGASKIYPLTDFKPRKSENLERGYLQGRYGAIPFLGDFSRIME